MNKTYTIKDFQISDFKDNHGNIWTQVTFAEEGEPVKWVMKPESAESIRVDTAVYGEIQEKTSKAGKPYLRFYKAKKEDTPPEATSHQESPERQESINRSVALNNAVTYLSTHESASLSDVLEQADIFLNWLKGTTDTEKPELEAPTKPTEGKREWSKLGDRAKEQRQISDAADELFPDSPPEGENV